MLSINRMMVDWAADFYVDSPKTQFLEVLCLTLLSCGWPASVAQSDAYLIGDQEVVGSIPSGSGNIILLKLIMEYFLWSFSPSAVSRRAFVIFWQKTLHKYWLTA